MHQPRICKSETFLSVKNCHCHRVTNGCICNLRHSLRHQLEFTFLCIILIKQLSCLQKIVLFGKILTEVLQLGQFSANLTLTRGTVPGSSVVIPEHHQPGMWKREVCSKKASKGCAFHLYAPVLLNYFYYYLVFKIIYKGELSKS